jgi:8-oxo-dGTP diphosphatase
MESEHFIGKIAQKAIIEKEGKVLISRHPDDTKWDLPGGRIHRGEQPLEGLEREILEELGVEVVVGSPFFAEMTRAESTGEERYFVAFRAVFKDETAELTFQKEEVAEARWISEEEADSVAIFEVCRRALRAYFTLTKS